MSFRQMQVALDPVQDRLLLRFSVGETDEVRAYLTRRILREIWPMLMSGLERCQQKETSDAQASPEETKQKEPPKEQDFKQPFVNDTPTYPLGPMPLLVGECTLEVRGGGEKFVLSLREPRERHFDICFDSEGLHMLCSMLKAAAQDARWDLQLEFETKADARLTELKQQESTEPAVNKLLH